MAKSLQLDIKLNSDQAERALNGFVSKLKDADAKMAGVTKRVQEVNAELNKKRGIVDQNSSSMDKYNKSFHGITSGTIQKGISAVGGAFSKTASQIGTAIKYVSLFSSVVMGVSIGKIFRELNEYSKASMLSLSVLRPKLDETKSAFDRMIFASSNKSGVSAVTMQTSTALLASSGLAPTAPEIGADGKMTEQYRKQMQELVDIAELSNTTARTFGENAEELTKSAIYYGSAMDYDMTKQENWIKIFKLQSAELDLGVGFMKEYSNQYAKFGRLMAMGGATEAEAGGIFAQMTKVVNPNQAGNYTKYLGVFLNDLNNQMSYGVKKIADSIAGGGMQQAEEDFLKRFDTMGEVQNVFMEKDPTTGFMKKKSIPDMMKSIHDLRKEMDMLGSDTVKQTMDNIFGTAKWTRMAWREITGEESYQKTLDIINQMVDAGESYDEKMAIAEDSFFVKSARLKENFKNLFLAPAAGLDPAMGAVLDILTTRLSGGVIDAEAMEKSFARAGLNIKDMGPMAQRFLAIIEKVGRYLASDKATKDFKTIAETAETMGKAIRGIMKFVKSVLDNPMVQKLLNFFASNPMAGLGALFGFNLLRSLGGMALGGVFAKAIAGAGWASVGGILGTAFLGVVAVALGAAVLKSLKENQEIKTNIEKKDLERSEGIEKTQEVVKDAFATIKESQKMGLAPSPTLNAKAFAEHNLLMGDFVMPKSKGLINYEMGGGQMDKIITSALGERPKSGWFTSLEEKKNQVGYDMKAEKLKQMLQEGGYSTQEYIDAVGDIDRAAESARLYAIALEEWNKGNAQGNPRISASGEKKLEKQQSYAVNMANNIENEKVYRNLKPMPDKNDKNKDRMLMQEQIKQQGQMLGVLNNMLGILGINNDLLGGLGGIGLNAGIASVGTSPQYTSPGGVSNGLPGIGIGGGVFTSVN